MKDQFQRILNLVRRTGDTMVVTDTNGENVYVVMGLGRYEGLLDTHQESVETVEKTEEQPQDIWHAMKPANTDGETWDPSQMNEVELADLERQYEAFTKKNVQSAIKEVKLETPKVAYEPKVADKKKEDEIDEIGEEAFYLEPID